MPKYDVTVNVSADVILEIEAENKEEAEEKAWSEYISTIDLDNVEMESIENIELAEGEEEEKEEEKGPTQEELEAEGQIRLFPKEKK